MKKINSFKIYNASAGSGKTFTLVKDYLVLLLMSSKTDAFKNILAITFTNKAVAEMKSRIVSSLHELSKREGDPSVSALENLLSKESGLSSDEIRKKSRWILKNIINNYSAFEVSTIDGFTHRVLRTFARDLDLPLNFEVALNTEEILSEAVERVISKAGEDEALTKVLVRFVLEKTDDDKSWDISRDLLDIAWLLTEETSRSYFDVLKDKTLDDFSELTKNTKKAINAGEDRAVNLAEEFFKLLDTKGIDEKDFTRQSCPNFFHKIKKKDFVVRFDSQWQDKIGSQNLYSKNLDDAKKEVLNNVQAEVEKIFHETRETIMEIEFLKAVEKKLVPLSLLSTIQSEVEFIKKENSIVLISEFNAAIGEAVKDQPAPFIYERLGDIYRHYFIDEFQDTSALQWENLIPLIDQTLSSEHLIGEHGSLTLVGDAKQSIYRWRGGKAEQFMELCEEKNPFSLEEKKVIVLPNNYRSGRTIVNFNNDFFRFSADCFDNEEHQQLFEASSQVPISERSGYVNISFVEANKVEEEMEEYPRRVLEIIKDLKTEKVPLSSICILTRKRKESIAIANYLSEMEISVISAESLLLSRSPEVNFINDLLQYSLNQNNRELSFKLLDYLSGDFVVQEDKFEFLNKRLSKVGQELFDSLKSFEIEFDLNELNANSIYEAVEYIIRSFRLVTDSNAYLQFYLDFVHEFAHSSGLGIFDFLDLWNRKKEDLSIVVPKGENAVQIMTIHRAKGLEFPVVIYPFANSLIRDTSRQSFWLHLPENLKSEITVSYLKASEKMRNWNNGVSRLYEELCFNSQLDALNLLYVALTRPVQRLYIISKLELNKDGDENRNKYSGLFISYLKNLGKWTGALEYEFGDPFEIPITETEEAYSVQQEHFYSSPTQANGISMVTRSGLLWDSRQQSAIEKGTLMHELFSRINYSSDVDPVLGKAWEEGLLKEQDVKEIRKSIQEVVEHPDLARFFSEDVLNANEKAIISGTGKILRPDRINFTGKSITIMDYKTGVAEQSHISQLDEYAAILVKMGYEIEKKLLVYLNEGVSIRVV